MASSFEIVTKYSAKIGLMSRSPRGVSIKRKGKLCCTTEVTRLWSRLALMPIRKQSAAGRSAVRGREAERRELDNIIARWVHPFIVILLLELHDDVPALRNVVRQLEVTRKPLRVLP